MVNKPFKFYVYLQEGLFVIGGIRCGELGGVMHGKDPELPEDGSEFEADRAELLRLAIPRRTYTESHMK